MKKKSVKDPHAKREADKYDNPIPSREYILDFLSEHQGPAKFEEIMAGLSLHSEDENIALSRRMRAMERDGQVVRNRKGRFGPVDKLDLVTGKVEAHKDGFGFFVPDEGGNDWYISAREMRRVFHGERVVVRSKGLDNRGRVEAKIVEVLESDQPIQVVGRYFEESEIGFVTPSDVRFGQDILVSSGLKSGATHGQVVVVRITSRPTEKSQPVGAIIQVLGDHLAPGMEIDVAIHNFGIRRDWPDEVLDQARGLAPEVTEEDKQNRKDLRHLPLVTIDGEDARDFDDAVYCEWKDSGGWRLWVAIADVSHYIQPGSALDAEAVQRGNSVYFPEYVVPMLPEQISNGLCSLNPKVDRLCMVCEVTVSAKGKISGYDFYPAVMHSKARLTYSKVWQVLQGDTTLRQEYHELIPHLEELYAFYQARAKERKKRGAIEFETTETRIVFNENRKIEKVVPIVRNDAHRIIEEAMICANVAAARYFLKQKIPGMYRIHEGPSEKKLEDLRSFLGEHGLFLFGGANPEPKHFSELLKGVAERPDAEEIQTMLLRSMSQAVYSPENIGHFGLAFSAYTHFTSPIRRYPDLLVHRMIKNQLAATDKKIVVTGEQSYTLEQLVQFGEGCSATERNAELATREVMDWLKCEFMTAHIGKQYKGSVVAVTNFGLFVRLEEFHIDGLVHITSLGRDYYHHEASKQRLVGERTGDVYKLGDSVEIEVAKVDLEDRKIDFELVQNGEKRSDGKRSERDRLFARAKRTAETDKKKKNRSGKKADAAKNEKRPVKKNKDGESPKRNRKKSSKGSAGKKKRKRD